VFDSELPDIDEFDVGERYKADVVRRAIESQQNGDEQTLDPNYLRILLDNLGRVATFTYKILSLRRVRPEAIQVLFRQDGEVKSLAVQKISDIQSPEVLMNLIHSHLTESVRDMMTPESGSAVITRWARSKFIIEIQAYQMKTGGGRNVMMTRLGT
jgi:hypothetical protein